MNMSSWSDLFKPFTFMTTLSTPDPDVTEALVEKTDSPTGVVVFGGPSGIFDIKAVVQSPLFELRDKENKLMVKVNPDGTVEYGVNYNPSQAAQQFWDAVSAVCPIHIGTSQSPYSAF